MSELERQSTTEVAISTETAVAAPAPRGHGEMLVHRLLARGRPQPHEVARLIAHHPDDRLAIIQALHQTLGNAFVAQVLSADKDHDHDDEHEHSSLLDTTTLAQVPNARVDPIDALLAWSPTQTRGPDGTAAWMLRAKELGFVTSSAGTVSELGDLRDNKQEVRTSEKEPGQAYEDEKRKQDKKRPKPRLDRVTKVGTGKTYEGYDVGIDESTILQTLVGVAHARIRAWRATGAQKKPIVLKLGDFVRGDAGFGGSPHTGGNAMDLFFLGANNNDGDVIDLLHDLPAGPPLVIVRDTNNALHLDRLDGRYGLGVPSMGDYLPSELDLEKTKAAAVAAAGNDHTQKLEATGIEWGVGWVQKYSATWNDKHGWVWTLERNVELAENRLKSTKLRDAIADYRARSKTPANAPTKPAKHHHTEHR